jgi:hypothetical protein
MDSKECENDSNEDQLIEDSEEDFQIETVLDRRVINGQIEYYIKWKGFSEEDNTWEKASSLYDNPLINEFENHYNSRLDRHEDNHINEDNNDFNEDNYAINEDKDSFDDHKSVALKEAEVSEILEKGVHECDDQQNSDEKRAQKVVKVIKSKQKVVKDSNKEPKGKEKRTKRTIGRVGSESVKNKKKREEESKPRPDAKGFDRKLQPEKICGATHNKGELMFLIKWKGYNSADLVPATIANLKCPQLVIEFYQKNIVFSQSKH